MNDHRDHDESVVSELSDSKQARLATLLDEYLKSIEQGNPVDPQELLAQHPADAVILAGYLSGLNYFHTAAARSQRNDPGLDLRMNGKLPQVLGDFQLAGELGRGGMGVVYDAIQISLGRRVALKVLSLKLKRQGQHIQRFKNEARAAACIEHPNIVPVFAVGEEKGVHYYAMQLIEGRSLAAILDEMIELPEGPSAFEHAGKFGEEEPDQFNAGFGDLPADGGINDSSFPEPNLPVMLSDTCQTMDHVRFVARLGRQAAEALHAAHEVGIVHRDVKPSNMLLDHHGKLWVTDFGLASCKDSSGITRTGDVLGTIRYMSPEQARGEHESVDRRSDVYSLGVTLYELASLHHPSGNSSDLQLVPERTVTSQIPLQSWNRRIPKDFQTIVMKSMAELPSDRYTTAKEMAEDLSRFVEGRPIQATPPTLLDRAGKLVRRHRKMATLFALMVLAAGLVQSVNNIRLQSSNREKEKALIDARQNLRHAQDVLDRFGTRLVDQLAAIPGAEGVRYQLLNDSLEFYEQFAARTSIGGQWNVELAHANSRMGSLCEKTGQNEFAIRKHSTALEIWRAQYRQQPGNRQVARNVALCLNNLGLVLAEVGQQQKAIELLLEAHEIQGNLIASGFATDEDRIELATTDNNLGSVFTRTGNSEEAVRCFESAVATQELLSVSGRESGLNLRSLAISHSNLSTLYRTTNPEKAESSCREAIQIQLQLVRNDPVNRICQSDLGCSYNNLGSLRAVRGDWVAAEAACEDAKRIRENLVRMSPLFATYRRDLAITFNNLGMAQSQLHQLRNAEDSFRDAIRLLTELANQSPTCASTVSDLGGSCNNLALLLIRAKRFDEADVAFQAAIQSQEKAFQISNSQRHRELLGNHYANYASLLRNDLHRTADADQVFRSRQLLLANNSSR